MSKALQVGRPLVFCDDVLSEVKCAHGPTASDALTIRRVLSWLLCVSLASALCVLASCDGDSMSADLLSSAEGTGDFESPLYGDVVRLSAKDGFLQRYDFRRHAHSVVIQEGKVVTTGSDLAYDCYSDNQASIGMSGGALSVMLRLPFSSSHDDESAGNFASLVMIGPDLVDSRNDEPVAHVGVESLASGIRSFDPDPGSTWLLAYAHREDPGMRLYLIHVVDHIEGHYLDFRWRPLSHD